MTRLKTVRLELDDEASNSHKFYEVRIDQLGNNRFRVEATWGRKSGFGRPSTSQSQIKDVVGDVISAMVVLHEWVSKKQDKGYRLVSEL
jgi:predicted DNA-binding WGR domain protein